MNASMEKEREREFRVYEFCRLPCDNGKNVVHRESKEDSEREPSSIRFMTERVDQGLAHEQPNGNTDSNHDHSVSDLDTVPLGCDTSRFGKARLWGVQL